MLESTLAYTSTEVGWQVTATDPLDREILVEHDYLGRAFRTTLPPATTGGDQAVYVATYFADGLVLGEIDPEDNFSLYDYDQRGRLTEAKAPLSGATRPTTSYS